MAKKTTKRVTREVTRRPPPAPPTAPPPPPLPPPSPAPPPVEPRRLARLHRASATPAQRRGAELVRYLRLHLKRPYGDRGVKAIVAMAREVGHAANIELDAREAN